MRLAKVTFPRAIPIGRHHHHEVSSETHGPIEADLANRVIRVAGVLVSMDGATMVPLGPEPAPVPSPCEVCGRKFDNAKALGGHRAQTGHGVEK